MAPLIAPEDVREWLRRQFHRQHRDWLRGVGPWPLERALGDLVEAQGREHPELVQQWIEGWRRCHEPGEVVWGERQWRTLGRQRVPERLRLATAEDVAAWIGEADRWARAQARFRRLTARWPTVAACLASEYEVLAGIDETELERLERMTAWLIAHPDSGLYPRQIPLPGLHTKWFERRRGLVATLVAAVLAEDAFAAGVAVDAPGDAAAVTSAPPALGLRSLPVTLRLRVLDADLRATVGCLSDLAAPVADLARLAWKPSRVLIVENLQTGLALPELPGTVAFMGMGYAVDALGALGWLAAADCVYWGDIDTHGFAILNRVRAHLPQTRSLMMDEATLTQHREQWVEEPRQSAAAELPQLQAAEQAVYRALRLQHWGRNVRLEQERIGWDIVLAALRRVSDGPPLGFHLDDP